MALILDGNGLIQGLSAGGLPNGSVNAGSLASTLDLSSKTMTFGNVTASGITFPASQSASGNPNTLDDYEEGTFTPTVNMSSGTNTGGSTLGTYVKIGRQVTITVQILLGTVSGGATIDGFGSLPFTARTANDQAVGLLRENANTGFGWEGRVNTGSTSVLLRRVSDNGAAATTGDLYVGTITYFV